MLPTKTMETRVRSLIDIFVEESIYPQHVQGYKTTQLYNETDAIYYVIGRYF